MNRIGRLQRLAILVAASGVIVAALAPSAAADVRELTLQVGPTTRLLVVAPHPDDESLGSGGLIQRVLAAVGLLQGDPSGTNVRGPLPRTFV